MFDVGFSELVVIGIVALIVIGPERLPKVARTAGHLIGRLQRYVNDVKADISREMQLDELKKLQSEMQNSARAFEQSVNSEVQALEKVAEPLQTIAEEVKSEAAVSPPAHSDAPLTAVTAPLPPILPMLAESAAVTPPAARESKA